MLETGGSVLLNIVRYVHARQSAPSEVARRRGGWSADLQRRTAHVLGLLLDSVERRVCGLAPQAGGGLVDGVLVGLAEPRGRAVPVVGRRVNRGVRNGGLQPFQAVDYGLPVVLDVVGLVVGEVAEDR